MTRDLQNRIIRMMALVFTLSLAGGATRLDAQGGDAEFEMHYPQHEIHHRTVIGLNNTIKWVGVSNSGAMTTAAVDFAADNPCGAGSNLLQGLCIVDPNASPRIYEYTFCGGTPPGRATCPPGQPRYSGELRVRRRSGSGQRIALEADGTLGPSVGVPVHGSVKVHIRKQNHNYRPITFSSPPNPCNEQMPADLNHPAGVCTIVPGRSGIHHFKCAAGSCSDPMIHVLDDTALEDYQNADQTFLKDLSAPESEKRKKLEPAADALKKSIDEAVKAALEQRH